MKKNLPEICNSHPVVLEKFTIDYVNSIDITQDHIRVLKSRSTLNNRIIDAFTGDSKKHQDVINENLTEGLHHTLKWLKNLTHEVANSYKAISHVNDRITTIQGYLIQTIDYGKETRNILEEFIDSTNQKLKNIEQRGDARDHLDSICSKLSLGIFSGLSPLGQCHYALNLLKYGDWGNWFYHADNQNRERDYNILKGKVVTALNTSLNEITCKSPLIPSHIWLETDRFSQKTDDMSEVNFYLGELSNTQDMPYTYLASQQVNEKPLCFPAMSDAKRIAEPLISEVIYEI